ncbi:calphotin-like [Schistocerca cancellata]|uniref:calphotin-like n=1 Tax=Schistocerca cancellata TaxID=274614 RepID=UPI002118AD04|nr:calphotin-like [Schistocerca cancellata]
MEIIQRLQYLPTTSSVVPVSSSQKVSLGVTNAESDTVAENAAEVPKEAILTEVESTAASEEPHSVAAEVTPPALEPAPTAVTPSPSPAVAAQTTSPAIAEETPSATAEATPPAVEPVPIAAAPSPTPAVAEPTPQLLYHSDRHEIIKLLETSDLSTLSDEDEDTVDELPTPPECTGVLEAETCSVAITPEAPASDNDAHNPETSASFSHCPPLRWKLSKMCNRQPSGDNFEEQIDVN